VEIIGTSIHHYLRLEAQALGKEEAGVKDPATPVHRPLEDTNTTKEEAVEVEDNNKNHKLLIYIIQSTNYTDNINTVAQGSNKEEVTVSIKPNTERIVDTPLSSNIKVQEVNTKVLPVKEVASVNTQRVGQNNTTLTNKEPAHKTIHTFSIFKT